MGARVYVGLKAKLFCVMCGAVVAIIKEYNLRQHYKNETIPQVQESGQLTEACEGRRVRKSLVSSLTPEDFLSSDPDSKH